MRSSVSRFAPLATLVLSLSAAGCGQVESGVCAGEQVDNVACTVDICDGEAKAWAHIPNDDLCEAGQRCDPTAGCVAAGALSGHATLFGHDDHSGITVSIDGVEGATATTDAKGDWSFGGLPTGTYTVTYTKDTFMTETQPGVSVLPEAASSPPNVELRHGNDLGVGHQVDFYSTGDYQNGVFYSPDRKHMVVRYFIYYSGTDYVAYNLGGLSEKAQPMFHDNYPYGPNTEFWVSNTHVIWNVNGQTIWARSLDGGAPYILGTALPNESITVVASPNQYVVLQKQKPVPGFTETTLYVVKADGSTPMGAPFFTQPDANHPLAWIVSNDTHALFGVNDYVANPPNDGVANNALRRVDLATGMVTPTNSGFATYDSTVYSQSPDRNFVFGHVRGGSWYRGFMISISGTEAPKLAPSYGAPSGTQYSDIPGTTQWFADSSGIVIASAAYGLSAGGTAEGGLKVWPTNAAQSTLLVAYNTYFQWQVHNKVVTYRDSNATTAQLKVVSAHSTSPVIYNLDTSGAYLQDMTFYDDPVANGTLGATSYLVWTQSLSGSNSTRAKILSVNLTNPLLAAPSVVQLGGTLAATCQYEATLSRSTYWQLCQDTGVLSGFTKATATAGTQTPMVRPGLIALPGADRIGFRKYDGKLYSSPNTGTLNDVKLVSAMWDGISPIKAAGNWVMFNDSDGAYLRASNADGSGIDEPQSKCRIPTPGYSQNPPQMYTDPDLTHVLVPYLRCTQTDFGEYTVPTANLP